MSANLTIVGTVVADPELRFTNGGKGLAKFSVVDNRKQGDELVPSFFDVVAWDTLGENLAQSLVKGCRVIVTGRLQQRTWEAKDGSKRSSVELVADACGPELRWATAVIERTERSASIATSPEESPF